MNNFSLMLLTSLSKFSELYSRYSQREQNLLIAASVALLIGVFNFLVFEPINREKAEIESDFKKVSTEIFQLNQSLQQIRQGADLDPNVELRRQIDQLYREISNLESRIAERTGSMVKPAEMIRILTSILKKRKDIIIKDINTQKTEDITPKKQRDKGQTGLLFKHTWEFTIEGSYTSLMSYFKEVEDLEEGIVWGEILLENKKFPNIEAKVRVHTLSGQNAALGV